MPTEPVLPVLLPAEPTPEADPIRQALERTLPWLTHGEPFSAQLFGTGAWLEQGWKLHISATPFSATHVLERALPVLLAAGARFKVVNTVGRLLALSNGHYGASQVGKFITVYPADETQAVELAIALDEGTRGLRGPRVPSDRALRPGSLVYYRYGAFRARQAAEGGADTYDLLDPGGRLTHDQRQQFYVEPPPELTDPFEVAGIYQAPPARTGALGERYLVTDVLARTYRGGVFKAIDLSAQPPCVCLLKEFWYDVGSDRYGRDVRAWGENEAELLARHAGHPLFPRCHSRFELDGNLYVAIEYVDGTPVDRRLGRDHDPGAGLSFEELVRIGRASATALAGLHALGIVFRDFKPGNLIRTPDGEYRLVDFGLACDAAGPQPPLEGCTPFYCSPQQYAGEGPSSADDIFSWGAALHQLAAGQISPGPGADEERLRPFRRPPLSDRRPDLPAELSMVIDRAVAWERADRYASVDTLLADFETAATHGETSAAPVAAVTVSGSAASAAQRLLDPLAIARKVGDALCHAAEERTGGLCWATRNEFERSEHRGPDLYDGAAGIALFLAELARVTGERRYAEAARGAARWLMGPLWGWGRAQPGFHCGEAGVGYLFLRLASLLDEPGYVSAAELRARRMAGVRFQTLDLFYGAGGAAVFLARLAAATGERAYLDQARAAGDLLLGAAQPAPGGTGCYWEVPASDPGLPHLPYLGLAHGAAGIAFALIELARATGEARYLDMARSAAELLLTRAVTAGDGGWRWPRSMNDREPDLQAQCHGAVGIGQFFLRLARLVPDGRYGEAAKHAAATAGAQLSAETCSGICHGLAGRGGFLLDCYQAFRGEEYLGLARRCGQFLEIFREPNENGLYRSRDTGLVSPDLMLGYTGVGAFNLRLAEAESAPDLILS